LATAGGRGLTGPPGSLAWRAVQITARELLFTRARRGSMSDLALRYVGIDYFDRTRPLMDGTVRPKGIALEYVPMEGERFGGFDDWPQADAVEMSVSKYLTLLAQGDERGIALPIYVSRAFRLDGIYLRADSAIREPKDLIGRRVGISDYQRTAALWQRGILMHECGVQPRDLIWCQTSAELAHPPDVSISVVPPGTSLTALLLSGEIDALFHGAQPPPTPGGGGQLRRLFPRWIEVEQDYYRRTGRFPIMHLVVLRRDVYARHPWVAGSLLEAFSQAKAVGWQRVLRANTPAVMLPWLSHHLAEIEDLMGPDHWPYGVAENVPTLDAMCQFHFEQGLSARRLQPTELFAQET
jgi:4,5-dihydroxyphthalate decarboxylase